MAALLGSTISWPVAAAPAAGEVPALLAERLTSPPALDGRVEEWGLSVGRWASFAWDASYLYFAALVNDESLEVQDDRSRDFAGSDRVVLLVTDDLATTGDRLGGRDFAFIFTPDSLYRKPLKTVFGFGGPDHPEFDLRAVSVAAAATANPQGYALEGRLPWSALSLSPHPGLTLGVAVVAFDVRRGVATTVTSLDGQPLGPGIGRHLLQPLVLSPQ
jgi:hypothetical protein